MVAGDVVNTAARLQSAAPVNGVLVDEHLRTDGGPGESWRYLRLMFDQSIFVKAAIDGVVREALIAAGLTALLRRSSAAVRRITPNRNV